MLVRKSIYCSFIAIRSQPFQYLVGARRQRKGLVTRVLLPPGSAIVGQCCQTLLCPLTGVSQWNMSFYTEIKIASFSLLTIYSKIIPLGFPGEMNRINRLIVTLSLLWFESLSCYLFFLPFRSGMNFNKV